ncbi:MAG: hypothetical protein R2991_02705 [Thermoanaerobaculia bacterium]
MRRRALRAYCWLAGLCDAGTGAALLIAPGAVLGLLGIGAAPGDAVFLRYVGVFVTGVGLLYLYPLLLSERAWARRVRTILESTALLRGAVALFVAVAVALEALPAPWLTVAAVDGALAAAQALLLARGDLDV